MFIQNAKSKSNTLDGQRKTDSVLLYIYKRMCFNMPKLRSFRIRRGLNHHKFRKKKF